MDFLCVGESIVDIITRAVSEASFRNTNLPVEEIKLSSGGDALNNAVDLAKLGNEVAFVGRVGFDILGDFILSEGRRNGVCMNYAVRSEFARNAAVSILVNTEGDRSMYYCAEASAEFCVQDVDLSLLDRCKVLQIGGTFHLPKFDGEGAAWLLKKAKEKGVLTSMDVTGDPTGRWNDIIYPCYPYLDFFLPSIDQAKLIAGTADVREITDFFLDRGVMNAAVKLGKQGSYFRNGKTAFSCGIYDVSVVEPTGAGDSFVSGFLSGVLKGFDMVDCVRLGTAVATFAIQAVGANTGVKDYATIMKFIKEKKGPVIQYDPQ